MPELLSLDYSGPAFKSLGAAHLITLAIVLVLNVLLARLRPAAEESRSSVRWAMAIALWTAEAAWHVWNLAVGTWTVQTLLPLNTCSILIWLSGIMLVRKDFRIYEFSYFLGIGGALQYLATPDLGPFGFPHFRFFQTFTSHGLLLTAPLYMTFAEGFRPTWSSFKRVVLWTNVYMLLVFVVNLALGSNYLMLNAKPATPSLLDLLPPWPLYLPYMEALGLLSCLLLYLPFCMMDLKASRASRPDQQT